MPFHPSAALVAAAATLFPLATTTAQPTPPLQVDCRAMSAMPGSPMTFEQCERQMAVTNQMQQAANMPDAERPGDDRMTCPQIVAELKQVTTPGVTPEHAAESVAAGRNLQRAQEAAMSEAKGAVAVGTATSAAAAAASIGPGGNAVSGAATQAQLAQQQAIAARQKSQLDAAMNRTMIANANSMADVAAMMRANPRFARLVQLAAGKDCSIP